MQLKSKSFLIILLMTVVSITTFTSLSTTIIQVFASSNTIDDFSQSTGTDNANTGETGKVLTNPTTTNGGPILKNNLVNPNAFNYQTNPASPTVDISKDPNQKVNTAVTNSFGQGVQNIDVEIKVKDPSNAEKTVTGKTDNDGKSIIIVPISTPGKYSATVTIKTSPGVGGPFTDTISWNAVAGAAPAQLTTNSKIARTTVDLSDDPRQQILSTVKDAAGKGVKDVPLTIKLTNPDGISKTFSRITDANGVDEFVTPVGKEGKWSAIVTFSVGFHPPFNYTWNAIP